MEALRGLDQLVRTINRLKDQTAKKAAKAGLNAGLTELDKAIKQVVNNSNASPELKRAARLTVGKRLLKEAETRDITRAKAGFGVGLSGKLKRAKAAVRVAARKAKRAAAGKKSSGVGVTAANIHWFVLGTKDRFTGAKTTRVGGRSYTKKTGNPRHHTGTEPAILHGVIQAAEASAGPAIIQAVRKKVQETIASEVHASQVPKLIH